MLLLYLQIQQQQQQQQIDIAELLKPSLEPLLLSRAMHKYYRFCDTNISLFLFWHITIMIMSLPSSRRTLMATAFLVPRKRRSSSRLFSSSRLITYLTDVEGDRDYLTRFVDQSRVLKFRPCDPRKDIGASTGGGMLFPYDHCIDFQNDQDVLVFGGDCWDQGGSDLYVIRQLLDLKDRHPDLVHFVIGNRDSNKMRMACELGSINDWVAPPHDGVYWLKGTGRLGDPMGDKKLSGDPVERLQWMLGQTMGSPRAFEYRRSELEQERHEKGQMDSVTDLDVVESYKQSTNPVDGEMSRYLSQAELAVKLGDILFVHGALPLTQSIVKNHGMSKESIWSDMTFAMPWLPTGVRSQCDTIYEWFASLNNFVQDSVDAWKEKGSADTIWATQGGYRPQSSYSNLVQYCMGGLPGEWGRNPTVVYQSWSDDGMPRRFFDNSDTDNQQYVKHVSDFFKRANIRLIVSGHQPQGDCPNSIRVNVPGRSAPAYIICSDTSYSGDTIWHNLPLDLSKRINMGRGKSRSGRGDFAVTEILIEQSKDTLKLVDTISHGTLSDGTQFETRGLFNDHKTDLLVGSIAVGELVPPSLECGPWWTRAGFADGSYLLTSGKKFDCWNRIVNEKI
jgi:hypothetical protein